MLFLDFLCLFFCIVLLNAHPISKRNSHNISELVKKLDNGHIVQSDPTDQLLNHLYPTWKGQIFEEQDGNKDEINKQDFTKIPKKHIKFKRITTKVMDLRDFERLDNFSNRKYLQNSIKTHKFKNKENSEANNINQITNSQVNPISRFLENKHVFYDMSMEPTRDDTEFAGTAEIEAILNEIKQREIEMIADQIPTVSTLIANTVTETTFASMPLISDSSIYPGFVFSTFLLIDNNTLVNFINSPQGSHLPYLKLHNIALRSVKDDTSTLAHDVENVLQNKIKKVYRKIKNKISKDFNKEIKKTKATIKEQIDKINKKTSPSNVGPIESRLQKDTTKPIPKTQTKPSLHEVRNSRNTLFNIQKDKLTTITTHTIPTVGDDLSMLSIVEQLLEKSEEDTAINMLTTKNNYLMKNNKEKLFKRNSLHETLKESNFKLLNNEEVLDTDNTHSENRLHNDTENINKIKMDATTEDTSYEGLSNKLSYSDYVNGFKYYLKFQKDKEEEKYSNQVRYQAHKHHSVDDIGKFILNKIPQLPTSRSRRDFVNLKSSDVQDVSTKGEDSWFKKHFFIFMDSNTPKKFHTAQTVSLKPSATQIKSIFLDNQTTEPTYNNKEFLYLVPRHVKKNIYEAKMSAKNSIDEPRYYVKIEDKRSGIVKTPCKRSNLEKQKSDALTSIHYRKNGFVDIDLINKPTAIIKLNNKNKKINKIRHIFNKIRFGHNKHKKKQKRQIQNRFNIFKEIRKIFKDKNQEFKNTKQHKIFDYEVMTTNTYTVQSYKVPTFKKIDELRQQVPNISADFSVPQTILTEDYLNLTDIVSMHSGQCNEKLEEKKSQLDDERKSFSILTRSQYLKDNELSTPYFIAINQTENNQKDLKMDDIINVSIETKNKDVVFPEQSNSVGYPEIMTKSIIRNEVDDLSMRLLSFDSKNEKQKTFPTSVKNGHKTQYLNLLRFNTYPKSKLSKEYQIHNIFINDFKKPATISSPNKKYWSKKSPRNNKLTFLFNSSPSLAQISSLSPLNEKKFQIDTKSNRQDIALKTFGIQPTPLVDPTMFAYRKSLNYLIIPDKNIVFKNKLNPNSFEDPKMFAYEPTLNYLTTLEGELAASYKNNFDIIKKKPFTKVNTPPEQYYHTPLPMQMDDFYKFLKSQNIDVDSVTAPLFDSVPKSINTCNLYKKNISKLSSKHDKIIQNKQHLKIFNNKLKAGGQSNKTHCHENLNKVQTKNIPPKKVQDKSRQEKQKEHAIGIDLNRKNTQLTGETPEYENSNCNEKHKRNLRKNSNLMSRLYLGSMDLFQFDNSPKQPVVIPQKEAKEMDVTVIDLESKTIDTNAYKELEITNFNKMNKYQRLSTKTNLSNNDISRTSFIDPQRDPLRFTHMYYEHTSPKQSMTSPLYSYLHQKTTLLPTQPRRIQISGHSYKYDIIYQKPNYDWMNDLYEVNPKLFTNNVVKYRNYTTTTKMEQGDHWYYRGNYTLNKNNDLIYTFAPNKVQKRGEIYNVDHSLPEYTSTEVENIPCPKKKVHAAKTKAKEKFFDSSKKVNNINNIDNEVYFEPLIRHKSKRSRSEGRVSNKNKKYYKRNVQGQDLFTAKDVAALEVIVDLIKSTESLDDKGFHNSLLDIDNRKNIPYIITSLKPQNHATNAIQVHIALPSNINDKKRSLEPVKVRKIFSAIMSSPVDLEYQIHSFEDDKVTKVTPDVISPGLYLLVENTNITVPKGNFALKPIKRNLILPKSSDLILNYYNNNKTDLINDHVSKVTLNPNILAAVTNQLVKLYENMVTLNETKSKKYIKEEEEENKMKIKRNINWESLKKYFSHDRLSQCHCRINKTMCNSCSASDVVITELMFEFENLARYMNDHCTEIQTFFWMNPTGGRKLKDTVHRIDTILNNSYKRVKGKCQGRTCKSISSNIDKREYKLNSSINQFLNDLESMADHLQKVLKHNITCDENVHDAGKKCISTINNCIYKNLNKRSYTSNTGELNNKSIYSLNNIRVNLICNKDLAKHATYYTRNTITEVFLERSTNTPLYYDEDEKTKKLRKNKKIGKGIKDLLKKYSNIIKFKNVEIPQIGEQNNNKFVKKHIKRHSISDDQIEAPFLADSGGTFWYKHLHDNMREPRQQKEISKRINIKETISHKSIFSNMNLTTTIKTTIENTTNKPGVKNDLQEKANETDDTYLNIDSLNHNLNDLFKLLGNTGTVSKGNKRIQENKSKLAKLSTLSKNQSIQTTNIHTSIKTISKLTTITKVRPTSNPNSKTTFKKDHLKLNSSQIEQNTKKKGATESKTTKTIFSKTPSPPIIHSINATASNPKVGLINRIVSGSLKFLSNSEKKATTLTGAKSSNVEHRTRQKCRLKLGANTNAFKEIYHYEIDNSEKSTTLTNPTIIIINDIGSSAKYTVSINKNLGNNDSMKNLSPDTVKRNSFKLVKEKKNVESSKDSLYNRVKLKNITQKVSELKKCEYYDYDIIHSIRKHLGLTSSNLTTPSERKGAINKLIDKFSIKIIEPDVRKASQCTISSKDTPKVDVNESVSDSSIEYLNTAATTNTTKNNSNKDILILTTGKKNRTQNNSGSHDHRTKHLEEAGEEILNQICDISSTMAYVFKLQKSMSKKKFERYVKNIPCHKYNKTPKHFIIRSCKQKQSKMYYKLNRKTKTSDLNKDKIHKWVWIRDKRFIPETTLKYFKENKKYRYSLPLIYTNYGNVDKTNGNQEVNYHREVKKTKRITHNYNIKNKNVKDNYKLRNIIHNIGFWKINLFSSYLPRRKEYKKKSHLNGNFMQLWYDDDDYYENFVRGKNDIYRKSLKRRKRLNIDMSELNDGLVNLSPLEPFTDEIYVMVANSISFACHSSGPIKNDHEDYTWTSDRLGILDFDNVMIEGPKVFIKEIKTNNFGNYICSAENAIVRNIKLTVIDLPNIDIVFTPLYEADTCTYDDLKSLQMLSKPMSYFTNEYDCSVRIDEPICLKDSVDGSALIRPIVVMRVKRQSTINCSAECLRDLHCSFALLFANNAPTLAFVKVLISYNGTKKILSPLRKKRKSFVTHTLRRKEHHIFRKDTNGHREYHRLAANMDPNSVNVVLLCSAGFYLVVGQKICAVCPPNTFSLEGENVCRNCPRGASSEPGARSCRLSLHLRRKECLWKYVCGGAVCMLSCVIASCYVVSRLLRQPVSTEEIKTCRKTGKATRKESHQKKSKKRPLSPSRVILSRLLRGSFSSSRATDSQETRFELWKEKNTLPPLPPIDFEF